jgi:hypothetical protein
VRQVAFLHLDKSTFNVSASMLLRRHRGLERPNRKLGRRAEKHAHRRMSLANSHGHVPGQPQFAVLGSDISEYR